MAEDRDWWDGYFDDAFVALDRQFLPPARTRREVRGVQELLGSAPGARVLDLACGWGRHAVELARRGYRVTGLDWSPVLLERARRSARRAGVEVDWVQGDVRELPWTGEFDAALSLFSSLGYFLSDAEDLRALRAARAALKPGGVFLLETMHRDQVVREYAERDWWRTGDGWTVWTEREWDGITGVTHETLRWRAGDREGAKSHAMRVRTATEWLASLAEAGFTAMECFGDWDGSPFLHTSENLIVVARVAD